MKMQSLGNKYITIFLFVLVVILSSLMRFYNFNNLQYFSGDEEILHAILRRMVVEGKPALVIPNAQIGGSIGSLFHVLSVPIFYLTNSNPSLVQLFGSALGIVTTVAIYFVGRMILGHLMGFFAGILYGGSFLISLFDRRFWPLTPDPLLSILAIAALIQLTRKKYKYALMLAIPASFAWQADPTNAVILVAIFLSFIFLRLPILRREYIPALIYLTFAILPLLIFELRHPGTIFRPLILHLLSRSESSLSNVMNLLSIHPLAIVENTSRSIAIAASNSIDQYFCYCKFYPNPPFSPLPQVLTTAFILYALFWLIRANDQRQLRDSIKVLFIFLFAFLLGIILYSVTSGYLVYQHYFVTIFPTFILLAAFTLDRVLRTRAAIFSWVFLLGFIFVNLFSLFNSTFKYPVSQKMELIYRIIPYIENSSFSVYGYGGKRMTDGGWTTFFIRKDHHPSRSHLNGGWDWIYRTHSLYTTNPDQGEGKRIVIFHDTSEDPFSSTKFKDQIYGRERIGNIQATILNNTSLTFEQEILDELQKEYANNEF
ncbi:MAG: Uncharacterized protein G01um10147_450 [Microgenomates group bacterium Gr01-1014_7]|nr:MAG: Uncharacterized protein G01um10147_450 [Microgenomates group bacterium Gr01-1014_7]